VRYIILFAGDCPACSQVARMVADASVPGLEARGFTDPEITGLLGNASLEIPGRPALVIVNGTDVQVLTGLAMRRRLAGVVGWRRARTMARLLTAEWRARLVKATAPRLPSRRGVLGGIVAGVVGWAVIPGIANAATGAASAPRMTPASEADAARVLRTATAQRSIRAWGAAGPQVYEISGGRQPVFVLTHPDRDIYTFIDNSPGTVQGGSPVAVSLGFAPAAEPALRYYTVDGAALADLRLSDGTVTAATATTTAAVQPEADPDGTGWKFSCWVGCIGRKGSEGCLDVCRECATTPGHPAQKLLECSQCFVCAGPNAIPCLKECNII
jgi:hypothetical protein